jgi:hypothetical protein
VVPNQHEYTPHLRISKSIVESVMDFVRDNFKSFEITGKCSIVEINAEELKVELVKKAEEEEN